MKQRAHWTRHEITAEPARVVSRRECWLATLGFGVSAALGGTVGAAVGFGTFAIPLLAPLVAGGAGVTAVVFSVIAGTLGALVATLPALAQANAHHASPAHGHGSFLMRLPVYGAITLALCMALTVWVITSRGLGVGEGSDQGNRLTWNLKNSTRIAGSSDSDTMDLVLRAVYPSTRPENSPRLQVTSADDWRVALAAAPLIAPPHHAVVMPIPRDDRPLIDVPTLTLPGDATEAAAQVDARVGEGDAPAPVVMVVAADSDYRYAMPAGAYAARTGAPLLFVTRDGIPAPTTAALERRRGTAHIYIVGGADQIPDSVAEGLSRHGMVQRVGGGKPFEHAVRFAEFYDPETGFGWGRTGRDRRQWNSGRSIVINSERWQDAIVAAHLSRRTSGGPLLFVEPDRVPALVDAFFWRQRPTFGATPAEGPFNHAWIIGSPRQVSYDTQAWIDYSHEIEQYMTLGDSAVSGFEALGIAWMALSFGSALWILLHSRRRLPHVMAMMKAAWVICGLLLGPVAVLLYVHSYNGVRTGLDPVWWTSSERWIRCPDRWQTARSAGRAGSLTTSSKPRPSAWSSMTARRFRPWLVTSI